MKKIDLNGLEKTLYYEKLKNGLEVYLLPYEDKKNYFISYATRYGSDVLKYKIGEEEFKPPLGIAHYLEHKMFEEESGEDPFTFFSCEHHLDDFQAAARVVSYIADMVAFKAADDCDVLRCVDYPASPFGSVRFGVCDPVSSLPCGRSERLAADFTNAAALGQLDLSLFHLCLVHALSLASFMPALRLWVFSLCVM